MVWRGNMNLLVNEKECKNFLEVVTPDLREDEVLFLSLIVRGKYCECVKRSGMIVDTEFIKDNDVNKMVRKVKKLGYVEGVYVSEKTGEVIPKECFAILIDVQPCSVTKAIPKLANDLVWNLYEICEGEKNRGGVKSVVGWKLWRSVLSKCRRKIFVDIDIDVKDFDLLDRILDVVGDGVVCAVETRGGFHVVVDRAILGRLYQKEKWIWEYEKIEISAKQVQLPVVGTLQGGFEVKMIRV